MSIHFLNLFIFILYTIAFANTVVIRNNEDFINLAVNASKGSFSYDILLETDLDFNDDNLKSVTDIIPLGWDGNSNKVSYTGTFDGNGHSIKNLNIDKEYSGLIYAVNNACIKNLTIENSCSFNGQTVGCISPNIEGNVIVDNVKVYASISVTISGSGILGYGYGYSAKSLSVVIENSEFRGVVSTTGKSYTVFYGGLIGYITSYSSLYVRLEHNVNSATISSEGSTTNVGGFFGVFSGSTNVTVIINDNTNDAYFKSKASPFSCGGFIGGIKSNTDVIVQVNGNRNSAHMSEDLSSANCGGCIGEMSSTNMILVMNDNENDVNMNFSSTSFSGIIGGFIGSGQGTNVTTKMENNINHANYGHVITKCSNERVISCGLFCGSSSITLHNCVNNGTIEGAKAYGIANAVSTATNIVSAGVVNGASESYSFWKESLSASSLLYGLNGRCANCEKNVVLFQLNKTDGRYHTLSDDHSVVDALLNAEAINKQYLLRWDHNLFLRQLITICVSSPFNIDFVVFKGIAIADNDYYPEEIFKYHLMPEGSEWNNYNEIMENSVIQYEMNLVPCHMIRIKGELTGLFYIEADGQHNLGDNVPALLPYFDYQNYVVGDMDNNNVLDETTSILRDMNIMVTKRHEVVLEFKEKILGTEIDVSELALNVSKLSGIEIESIIVQVEVDESGFILRIVLLLPTDDDVRVVEKTVSEAINDQKCPYGRLCHATLKSVATLSLSHGEHNCQHIVVIANLFFFILMMII